MIKNNAYFRNTSNVDFHYFYIESLYNFSFTHHMKRDIDGSSHPSQCSSTLHRGTHSIAESKRKMVISIKVLLLAESDNKHMDT